MSSNFEMYDLGSRVMIYLQIDISTPSVVDASNGTSEEYMGFQAYWILDIMVTSPIRSQKTLTRRAPC